MSLGSGILVTYNPQAFATVNVTAGSGLTGGGTQGADHRMDVIASSGLTSNDNNVQIRFFGTIVSGCSIRWNGTAFVSSE